MGPVPAVAKALSNYANFSGRASRSEFWWFTLFSWIATFGLSQFALWFGVDFFAALSGLAFLALLVPSLAIGTRRLHDSGKSGLFWAINFIPVIGQFIFLAWMAQESQVGDNWFGPNPHGYGSEYYQSQQYLPPVAGRRALPAPIAGNAGAFGGIAGVNAPLFRGATPEPMAVPARRAESDAWMTQFNATAASARRGAPDQFRGHFFTEQEQRMIDAGHPQSVLLQGDDGDLYYAEVQWNGRTFTEKAL
jgi:uncharacterized membrane protein YhaH (DUF805 family)